MKRDWRSLALRGLVAALLVVTALGTATAIVLLVVEFP